MVVVVVVKAYFLFDFGSFGPDEQDTNPPLPAPERRVTPPPPP